MSYNLQDWDNQCLDCTVPAQHKGILKITLRHSSKILLDQLPNNLLLKWDGTSHLLKSIKGQVLILVEETPSFGYYSSLEQMKTHYFLNFQIPSCSMTLPSHYQQVSLQCSGSPRIISLLFLGTQLTYRTLAKCDTSNMGLKSVGGYHTAL